MNKINIYYLSLLYKVSEESLTAFVNVDVEALDRGCFRTPLDF